MTRLYYLRDKKNICTRKNGLPTRGNPVLCLITDLDVETKTVKYAYCVAHPADNFIKKLAIEIVKSRLLKKPSTIQDVAGNNFEITKRVMKDIYDNTIVHGRVSKMVKVWLKEAEKEKPRKKETKKSLSSITI